MSASKPHPLKWFCLFLQIIHGYRPPCTYLEHTLHVLSEQVVSRHLEDREADTVHDLPALQQKSMTLAINAQQPAVKQIFQSGEYTNAWSEQRPQGHVLGMEDLGPQSKGLGLRGGPHNNDKKDDTTCAGQLAFSSAQTNFPCMSHQGQQAGFGLTKLIKQSSL